jgi:hypothetical protein
MRTNFAYWVGEIKFECIDVTYHFIKELLKQFSNNEVMNALGIVYPQY